MKRAVRRRWGVASAATLGLLVLAIGGGWELINARCFALTGELVCRAETERPIIALTFDDGPTEEGTALALAELGKRGARATFFLIGEQAGERPHLVRRIIEAGHEIGNHSLTHRRMVGRSSAFYDREIAEAHRRLVAAGAPPPRLFRPPYGKKLWGLPRAVSGHGYTMVMIDVEEPAADDPAEYAERIVRDARPGSILLMHLMYRNNRTEREALPLVLDGLRSRGFQIVGVSELIAAAR